MTRIEEWPICAWRYFGCAGVAQVVEAEAGQPRPPHSDDVVAAAADPQAAYLIRSRLRRAILSCARLVADTHGAPKPDVPGLFAAPPDAGASDDRVIALCNRIFFSAQELCQPSESFDVRWEHGWALLRKELGDLARRTRRPNRAGRAPCAFVVAALGVFAQGVPPRMVG